MDLKLVICDQLRHAKTDICLVDRITVLNEILLLLQEKMPQHRPVRARAQLIAEIVAGFNQNNMRRLESELPPLVEKVSYFLVIVDALPLRSCLASSWSVVTEILQSSCQCHPGFVGPYSLRDPPRKENQRYCFPPIPANRRKEGKKPLDNRLAILKCYEAFNL